MVKLIFMDANGSPLARVFLKQSLITYVAIGSLIWIVDMNMCEQLTPLYRMLGGATFHNVWHIAAGLGAHLLTQSQVAQRCHNLGTRARMSKTLFGLVSVVETF
jgi:hypothetical protein